MRFHSENNFWRKLYLKKPSSIIKTEKRTYTDRNILDNFLQVVIYLALVANIYCETWKKNVLKVKTILLVLSNFFSKVIKQYLL